MKNHFVGIIDSIITILVLIVAGLTPLLVFNQTTEFYEMPKIAFLVVTTVVLYALWIFSWILRGKVSITRTPIDIPLILLLIAVLVSTFFSDSRISAIYGNFPKVHGSAVSWVTYILLYFVTVSNLKTSAHVKTFLYVLYGSAVAVGLISLLAFFGIFLPYDFAKGANFTPTGSSFSTVAFLLLLLPLPLVSIINPNKYMPLPMAMAVAAIFGVTVVLLGSIPTYIVLGIIFLLCFFAPKKPHFKTMSMFLVPVAAVVIAFVLAYVPIPGVNPIQKMEANFPKEVQLPFVTSWKISASVFRDAPFIGTGPSTYLFNFTSYKPVEFNRFNFWSFSFDSAYNEFLQTLGTVGVFGLASLILLCLVVFFNSWRNVRPSGEDHDGLHAVLPGLAVSGVVTILLLAVHATTVVSVVATFMVLAALMASQKSIREKVMNLSMGLKASTSDRSFDLFPVIIFIVFIIGAAYVLFMTTNTVLADYWHRQALAQANKNGTLTYQYLQRAESLNPFIDLYRVDMAQTNFALANALVAQKGPTQANPKGSLTDRDRTTIQTLISQAINEGRVSVALSPRSSRNWAVLASIYRNIAGVAQNALAFSLDAYGRSIQRDPLNPALRLNVGGIYYSVKNYNLAIRFFTDAANLKPDYANAYFNLAIALRDNNELQNAIVVAQQAVTIIEQNGGKTSQDYKVATALVNDLKKKANDQAKANQQTAPASQTSSALGNQNENVGNVDVKNLNNPPSPTPVPSVKPNPSTNIPQPTPAQR